MKKDKDIRFIMYFVLFSALTYELINRPFGNVTNLKIAFDDKIPFIKELIIIYHTFMPMIAIIGYLLMKENKDIYFRYVAALFLAQISAYVIYYNFQTVVPRYDVSLLGDDIFSKIVRLTYSVDNNYAGAPSMHVCNSMLAAYYIYRSSIKNKVKWPIILYMTLVAATTVPVKQHVILDVPTGMLHAFVWIWLTSLIFKKRELPA